MTTVRYPKQIGPDAKAREEALMCEAIDDQAERERKDQEDQVAIAQERGDLNQARWLANKFHIQDAKEKELQRAGEITEQKVFREEYNRHATEEEKTEARAKAAASKAAEKAVNEAAALERGRPTFPQAPRLRGSSQHRDMSIGLAEARKEYRKPLERSRARQKAYDRAEEEEADRIIAEEESNGDESPGELSSESEMKSPARVKTYLNKPVVKRGPYKKKLKPPVDVAEHPEQATLKARKQWLKGQGYKGYSSLSKDDSLDVVRRMLGHAPPAWGRHTASARRGSEAPTETAETEVAGPLYRIGPGAMLPTEEEYEAPDLSDVYESKGHGLRKGRKPLLGTIRSANVLPDQYQPIGELWEVDVNRLDRSEVYFRSASTHRKLNNRVVVTLAAHPTPHVLDAIRQLADDGGVHPATEKRLTSEQQTLLQALLHMSNGGRLTADIAATLGMKRPGRPATTKAPRATLVAKPAPRRARAPSFDEIPEKESSEILIGELSGGLNSSAAKKKLLDKLRTAHRDGRITAAEFRKGVKEVKRLNESETEASGSEGSES